MSADAILQEHPAYARLSGAWKRYRAFGGGLVDSESKKPWLPQGSKEEDADYEMRLKLTHDMGWTAAAIRRMAGTLTKEPATFSVEKSSLPKQTQDALAEWRSSVDGNSRDADSWWGDTCPEILRMGIAFVEVCRDRDEETDGPDGLPYLCVWHAEEAINWSCDKRGALEWIVLKRTEHIQEGHDAAAIEQERVRILTRMGGFEYIVSEADSAGRREITPGASWDHGLNMVPVVPHYAHREAAMLGRSYIDQISLGDWRKLQLESDQAVASWLHGSPRLVVKSGKDINEVVSDTNRAFHLNGEEGEDVFYLSMDATGMEIRERIIERTSLEALNSAGIDPAGVATSEGVTARSGVSLALTFSTTEEPTLNGHSEEMDAADRLTHELVTRYLTDGDLPGPHERVFDGNINRAKQWDLMSADQLVGLWVDGGHKIPSATFHRHMALATAKATLPDLPEGVTTVIRKEIEKAPDADFLPMRVDIDDAGGQSVDDGEPDGHGDVGALSEKEASNA